MEITDAAKYSLCPPMDSRRRDRLTQRCDLRSFGDMIHFQKELDTDRLGPLKHTSEISRVAARIRMQK